MSLGISTNFYNEVNALPGFLESASQWADQIILTNAGPGGKHSDDGSIEIAEKWGVRVDFDTIDEGFGVLRTKLIRKPKTDWVIIMDCDERIHMNPRAMTCHGTDRYPKDPDPKLQVEHLECYNQIDMLKSMLRHCDSEGIQALQMSRRHWFDFTWTRPCENWQAIRDWQLRCLKNVENLSYARGPRMHEHLSDLRTNQCPRHIESDEMFGPFFDHYHLWFKGQEPEQRAHDVRIYNSLDSGQPVPTV